MFISLAILLLIICVLSFWVLKESQIRLRVKLAIITTFFLFSVLFGTTLKTFLGWAADGDQLPRIVTVYQVVIKEPSVYLGTEGRIFVLTEHPATKYDAWWLQLFGHVTSKSQPRLFELPYSRELHETLAKEVVPRLQRGQVVTGKFIKGKGKGKGQGDGDGDGDGDGQGNGGRKGGKGGRGGRGNGGESLETEYQFHILPPGYFRPKE